MTRVHVIKREFAQVAREAPKQATSYIGSYVALIAPGAAGMLMGWKASQDLKGTNIFQMDDTISYMW